MVYINNIMNKVYVFCTDYAIRLMKYKDKKPVSPKSDSPVNIGRTAPPGRPFAPLYADRAHVEELQRKWEDSTMGSDATARRASEGEKPKQGPPGMFTEWGKSTTDGDGTGGGGSV
jgi:hypothetical protein